MSWDVWSSERVGFTMDVLLPRHSQLHLGSNRGDPVNYLHLLHPHVCCEEGGSSAQSSVLAAGGASLNLEGFGSRADNSGCCRPWGALRGSGPPPELCEPHTCL